MSILTIFGVTEILYSFKLVLEVKTGKEIPESSRLEFLENFSAKNFALSNAEDNTSGPLSRGGAAGLPLLRTILAIRQKFQEPSFWVVIDSFVLLAHASLAASRTLLQQVLATKRHRCVFCSYTQCTNYKKRIEMLIESYMRLLMFAFCMHIKPSYILYFWSSCINNYLR